MQLVGAGEEMVTLIWCRLSLSLARMSWRRCSRSLVLCCGRVGFARLRKLFVGREGTTVLERELLQMSEWWVGDHLRAPVLALVFDEKDGRMRG